MDTYTAVCHIASILDCDFAFPPLRKRQPLSNLPEIQLVSMLVVATKLYHPFDSVDRYTRSLTEIGYLTIHWDVWVREHKTFTASLRGNKPFEPGSELNFNEHDAMAMSDEQMDHYLDWYEKTWIDSEEKEHTFRSLPQELLDMFPTGRPNVSITTVPPKKNPEKQTEHEALIQRVLSAQKSLKTRGIVSEGKVGKQTKRVRRIGSSYKRYRRVEDLPDYAKAIYEATAKLAGLSLQTLVLAVFRMERKLQTWREEELRREAEEDGSADLIGDELGDTLSEENSDVESDHSVIQSDNG